MQDIEFTVERGKLWVLQCRSAKRSAAAAVKIAADMVKEHLISREEALMRIEPASLSQLLHAQIDRKSQRRLDRSRAQRGSRCGCGHRGLRCRRRGRAGSARAKRSSSSARDHPRRRPRHGRSRRHPHLPRRRDLACGGRRARHGQTCVVGCESLLIDLRARRLRRRHETDREGDQITIDGTTGNVYRSASCRSQAAELTPRFGEVPEVGGRVSPRWTSTPTPTPPQTRPRLASFGAEGIGLCRTEHMFMQTERLPVVQEMIMARDAGFAP